MTPVQTDGPEDRPRPAKSRKKSTPPTKSTGAAGDDVFAKLLLDQPPLAQSIARKLRKIVREILPTAEENVLVSARLVMYSQGKGMEICGIQPNEDRCNFYLTKGAMLSDPDNLLEGRGKGIRHMKVYSVKEMPVSAIRQFIRQGKALTGA